MAILIVLVGLIIFFVTYLIPQHQLTIFRFKNAFSQIKHPDGAELLQHYTYFGINPLVSGGDTDECGYYMADIRSIPDKLEKFNDIEKYYADNAPYFNNTKFSDVKVQVIPALQSSVFSLSDFPALILVEDHLQSEYKAIPAYIVYIVYIDESSAGDFRCLEI